MSRVMVLIGLSGFVFFQGSLLATESGFNSLCHPWCQQESELPDQVQKALDYPKNRAEREIEIGELEQKLNAYKSARDILRSAVKLPTKRQKKSNVLPLAEAVKSANLELAIGRGFELNSKKAASVNDEVIEIFSAGSEGIEARLRSWFNNKSQELAELQQEKNRCLKAIRDRVGVHSRDSTDPVVRKCKSRLTEIRYENDAARGFLTKLKSYLNNPNGEYAQKTLKEIWSSTRSRQKAITGLRQKSKRRKFVGDFCLEVLNGGQDVINRKIGEANDEIEELDEEIDTVKRQKIKFPKRGWEDLASYVTEHAVLKATTTVSGIEVELASTPKESPPFKIRIGDREYSMFFAGHLPPLYRRGWTPQYDPSPVDPSYREFDNGNGKLWKSSKSSVNIFVGDVLLRVKPTQKPFSFSDEDVDIILKSLEELIDFSVFYSQAEK